ncbi:tryptophan 2,3-dioxygenase family protein [Jatrophihabitans telluris]|uniref:Tryptophan 2,3-dioxygenase n=1 Tax=Jatrophihabitans telluris TaxID=2038343 RepID=A0ABY4R2H1_9ACTN|nr:tryptophan 2,3-dioxygenase family protein [Jatrophihabitans telluris]UQX89340.1 tryptophan 2,3-dioxygenase family protein [Jatrophihabitans telluris]
MTAIDTDAPNLQYSGRTPYVSYTDADVLAGLIHPQTDEPLEVTFIVATQIMELHFQLLIHDLRGAIAALHADDLPEAGAAIARVVATQKSLVSSWQLLAPMSAVQYNRFRASLGKASGFQSFAYRELEFLLGAKNERMLAPHSGMPVVAATLQRAYDEASVYDAAIALLGRRGLPVPAGLLSRDVRQAHTESDPGLVEAWRLVYAGEDELTALADALTAVAEQHSTWRFVHYTAVMRILGAKPGTGGSAGLAWLKRSVDTPVFVELWEVRSVL